MDIPAAWDAAATEIVKGGIGRIMMIGASGLGKSTFCRFLAARLLAVHPRVAVIDADLGQKDIGPPTAVTLGFPAEPENWGRLDPAELHFVGATDPCRHFSAVAMGVVRLARRAGDAPVIIDTSGLIRGPGLALKSQKIEAVEPDLLVVLEKTSEAAAILSANPHVAALRIAPSALARNRSQGQRRAARREAFTRHFADAASHRFAPGTLTLRNRAPQPLPGLLCGLADKRGRGFALAIVEAVDDEGGIRLFTPADPDRARLLSFGGLYLTPDGQERQAP